MHALAVHWLGCAHGTNGVKQFGMQPIVATAFNINVVHACMPRMPTLVWELSSSTGL